jgi:hypothetical protein
MQWLLDWLLSAETLRVGLICVVIVFVGNWVIGYVRNAAGRVVLAIKDLHPLIHDLRLVLRQIQTEAFPTQVYDLPRDFGSILQELRRQTQMLESIYADGIGDEARELRAARDRARLRESGQDMSAGPKGKLPD